MFHSCVNATAPQLMIERGLWSLDGWDRPTWVWITHTS